MTDIDSMSLAELLLAARAKMQAKENIGNADMVETWIELAAMRDLALEERIYLVGFTPFAAESFEELDGHYANVLEEMATETANFDPSDSSGEYCVCGHKKLDHRPKCQGKGDASSHWCQCARSYGYAALQDRAEIAQVIADSKALY